MNNKHLIDSIIFDTSYSEKMVAFEQRSEIDDFVKNNLLNVIDEVFDKVDHGAGNSDSVFRIDKLEIDLGNIPYCDFRQQMPIKLHEQLLLALRDVRRSATKIPLPSSNAVDSKSAAQAQLFYFLRNGYLPWYSRLTNQNALESLLIEAVDTTPATLIEFMCDKAQQARVLERLTKQFSEPTVQRVMGLLPSLENPENNHAVNIDKMEAKMVSALLTGDIALIEFAWQAINAEHSQLLKKILHHVGQQVVVRHNIAASFSPSLFNELLCLLEPAEHNFVQLLIDHAVVLFQSVDDQKPVGGSRQTIELREFTLAYLLVERGNRFSRKSYLGSLVRQMSASSNRSQAHLLACLMENTGRSTKFNKLAGDVPQLLRGLAADMKVEMARYKALPLSDVTVSLASDKDLLLSGSENQKRLDEAYERFRSALTQTGENREYSDARQLEDIKILIRDAPHLLKRLLGELQTGSHAWRQAIDILSIPVLTELSDAHLLSKQQTDLAAEMKAEVARYKDLPLSDVTVPMASDKGSLLSGSENQKRLDEAYERLTSALTQTGANREYSDARLLEDIKILILDAPHLLKRLFSEIQTDSYAWRQVIETLSIPVLAELSDAHLLSHQKTDLTVLSDSNLDLLPAIRSNAEKSQDKKTFFIHILSCLIKGEVIDFNAIRSEASYKAIPVATPSVSAQSVHKTDHPLDKVTGSVSSVAIDASKLDQVQSDELAPLENIYIANAGAVLFASYLPRLFERLGLIDRGKFKNRDAAEQGVHCVQFLVNGSISSPEYQLVLNKLLCGVKPGLPIRRSIELTIDEKEQLEAMLHAISQHWKPLANTSITGLRESFLQRNGSLQLKSEAWHLSVEARSFDMLLDQIPWSYSTIKLPWMDRVIYVEWR